MSDPVQNSDPRQAEMDDFLRRSLSAPVPRLSPDFHQVLSRKLLRRSQPPSRFAQILLAAYVAVSVVVCVVVMHSQGLNWVATAVATIVPLAALELARRARRSSRAIAGLKPQM